MGQEPALTDIPHISAGSTANYQAMIVENDDWLHEFALSQLQPNALPAQPADATLHAEQLAEPAASSEPAGAVAVEGVQAVAGHKSGCRSTAKQVCSSMGCPASLLAKQL